MEATAHRAIAVVGVGAILPDAPDAGIFWNNVQAGRYSVSDVTPDRWDPRLYFDPDPKAPEKSYSKIGGWVRDWRWDPLAWGMRILPAVAEAMDDGQKWAVACTRQALADFGYPERKLDLDRTAVILGNAMAGEKHYMTALRVFLPEYAEALASAPSFGALPLELRQTINAELARSMRARLPDITEDTMPGELSNCIAGRVANLFNLHGPNYVVDAACASAMAAISAAIEGLDERDFDTVVAGGIDRNMGASAFVKFCKIGALSATGTRPYAAGADGFVMGEGAAVFLLKRLVDAERDGDRVYAVIRGIGGSSDGKGKGITAPNPVGQKLAITRAWENAALSPATVTLVEGHGTSTRVGDVVETQSLTEVFGASALPRGSIALGSVKSNIGHLKAAAGAAGLLKVVMALRDKVLPPSINFERPNPDIDFEHSPFAVNRELRPWDEPACGVRRAGLSAFGFGGTNFHLVLEEHVPGRLTGGRDRASVDVPDALVAEARATAAAPLKAPLRGALVVGAGTRADLLARLTSIGAAAAAGRAPAVGPPAQADLRAAVRIAIDHGDAAELADKVDRAKKALAGDNPIAWKALRGQGIFLGEGPAPKVAFLYTGQGSQYVDMLKELVATEPLVAEVFAEADRVMTPILGKPLTEYVFASGSDASALGEAEENLRQTAITQPAVLATDAALTRLLAAYGVVPDVVMGHSLGEYAALVAAGGLPFADALEAVSARGQEMTNVSVADNGRMAAVMAPLKDVERILASIPGYVVIANLNSNQQAVIGGASAAVAEAIERFRDAGFGAVPLNVSHAFHTEIVAPASEPLRRTLERLRLAAPRLPVVANVDGQLYPSGPDARERMLDLLARQVASPVQFVAGLRTLHASGVRLFVEVGPKRALAGFVDDVFDGHADVVALHTNHPKNGDRVSFNQALCGLYAAGLGAGARAAGAVREPAASAAPAPPAELTRPASWPPAGSQASLALDSTRFEDLGRMFAEVLERGWQVYRGDATKPAATPAASSAPVVVTGAALGLPGTERVFDDANVSRILHGQQLIDLIPTRFRRAILDKHITRLAKKADGAASFETIDSPGDVIKLAGRAGQFDLGDEFGVALERIAALDTVTRLAIGAGLDALRDAGIPLVLRYKTTSKGTRLPDRWMLPEALRDETGVVFASAFPGLDSFAADIGRFHADRTRREKLATLARLRSRVEETAPSALRLLADLDEQIHELEVAVEREPFSFDRRFLFRILAMGHSQFAELIGARGPNTHVNAACASTTQAVAVAEDWIRQGRARRVIVVSGDDVTSDNLLEWIGSGFLASGAAATDDVVEDAAIPFDRRRHGMILGMGAAAFVVEDPAAARARGLRPICEVLSAVTANSAFHGTRLDVDHIAAVMETLVARAEQRHGIRREQIAPQTVFVSHETYTPARGGSAAAEVRALRQVFGAAADRVVIANTKGFTGHAMGVGIEDVVAIKALETGLIPPVANFKEADPELGHLNLSKGGVYPVQYALRLGAGFGSQISMTLCRWVASVDGSRPSPDQLGYRYRVTDPAAFRGWLDTIGGHAGAELEVVKRTLRVVDPATQERAAGAHRPSQPVALPSARAAVVSEPAARVASASAATVEPRAPSTPAPAPVVDDAVKERVLALFAEKTGYPRDMLAEDLDLEADLGIDTVKQAELFATVRETFAIPREEKLKLRDFPTLGHVIGFVKERRPDLVSTPPAAAGASAGAVAQPPVGSPPASPAAVAAPASPAADALGEQVLALFAEKTGYPRDMLDPDLDLEADLGIDTVKQAELFATVRETFAIPRDEKLKLRDFPTLGHVIGFVRERRPDLAAPPPVAVEPTPPTPVAAAVPPSPAADALGEQVLALFAEKTGYPRDMLDPDLDLEADLGIDTVKQAELFATVRETFAIPRDEKLKLRDFPTLGHVIGFVRERRPDLAAPSPVAVEPTPPTPVAAAVPPSPAADALAEQVLALFAEKTGYPRDMLDPDLDLEADLGIDTVKQAELFATVRETFAIPRDEKLKLRDFPTLGHVIGFVRERRPDLAAPLPAEPAVAVAPAAAGAPLGSPVCDLSAANAIPRRVPTAVLRSSITLSKATGVSLGESQRVVVMPDAGGVAKALVRQLKKRGVRAVLLEPTATAAELEAALVEALAVGPVTGIYWLPALDPEGDLASFDLAAWRAALALRVKLLYTTTRKLYEDLGARGTFLVAATRLGGRHGYDDVGALHPLGGAVTGFTKTVKRERPQALVKAVDFEDAVRPSDVAQRLIDETLFDPGVVEVGWCGSLRFGVALEERAVTNGATGMELGRDSVFLVTGAAGGITSAIVADLAAASGGTFHLLDLVAAPDPTNPDLARFGADKEGLKRELFERIKARGERATPALVEKELAVIERSLSALAAVRAVENAGGRAYYHRVDLRDPAMVDAACAAAKRTSGRIDVLLHAGGLEVSRFLPDKPPAEFDLIFDVKSDGWFNLMKALGDTPVGATVAFSSVAGRFGNGGQADYAAANDLLCKLTSNLRIRRPETRGLVIDWTAWGDIGMASRGSIPKMMAAAGIDMLPAPAGIPIIRRELAAGASRGEIVVGLRLGVLVEEWDEHGGLDVAKVVTRGAGPMVGAVAGMRLYEGFATEVTLDPQVQPFLNDHRIDGTPVLPGVMGIEGFVELSRLVLPDWHVAAVEDVRFLAPCKFYRNEPRTVRLVAQFRAEGGEIIAETRLVASRAVLGQGEAQSTTHFTARVRLSRTAPRASRAPEPPAPDPDRASAAASDVYRVYFHGPAYRVIDQAWRVGGGAAARLAADLPADREPPDQPLLAAPRLVELCFQAAGVWQLGTQGRMALPQAIESLTVHPGAEAPTGEVRVATLPRTGGIDAHVVDGAGRTLVTLRGYRTIELPDPVDEVALAPLRAAMA